MNNKKKERKSDDKFYQNIFTFFEIPRIMPENKKHSLREYLKRNLKKYYEEIDYENSNIKMDVNAIWNFLNDTEKKIFKTKVKNHILEKYLDDSKRKKIEEKLDDEVNKEMKILSNIKNITRNQEAVRFIEYYNPENPEESYKEITRVCKKYFTANLLPNLEEWEEDNNKLLKHSIKYKVKINPNFSYWREINPTFKDWFESLGDLKEILKKDSSFNTWYNTKWNFNNWFDSIRYGTYRIHDYLEDALIEDQKKSLSTNFPKESVINKYIIKNIIKSLSVLGITILKDEIEKDLYTVYNDYPSDEYYIANYRLFNKDYFTIEEKENGNAIDFIDPFGHKK